MDLIASVPARSRTKDGPDIRCTPASGGTAPSRGRRGARGTPGTSRGLAARGFRSASGRRRTRSCRKTDSPTNSNRVRVDEQDGMAARVEEDGIRRLWAHAVLCEQVVSDYVRRSIEISRQVAIRSIQQVAAEVTEPFRFGPIQARDFHVSLNDRHRGRRKRAHLEEARLLQVLNRLCDTPPCRLLHEQCADDHLEGVFRGPPTLRAVMVE